MFCGKKLLAGKHFVGKFHSHTFKDRKKRLHFYGLWFMVYGLWFMVYGLWFMIYGLWFMVYGLWFMVYGLWFMVYGLWLYDTLYRGSRPLKLRSLRKEQTRESRLNIEIDLKLNE